MPIEFIYKNSSYAVLLTIVRLQDGIVSFFIHMNIF